MSYCVYLFQNRINLKIYIGKTKNFVGRVKSHISASKKEHPKTYFHKALKKYGVDNFNYFEIENFESEEDSLSSEKFWIEYFQSNNSKIGYNLTKGGEGTSGFKMSESAKKKLSEDRTGDKHHFYGKTHTPETIDLMSKVKTDPNYALSHTAHYKKLSQLWAGENSNSAKLNEADMRFIFNKWFSLSEEDRKIFGSKRNFYKENVENKFDLTFNHFRQTIEGRRWKNLLSQFTSIDKIERRKTISLSIEEIFSIKNDSRSLRTLAKIYNVGSTTIWRIKNNKF